MIEETEALESILKTTPGPVQEELALGDAGARYLCEELRARVPLPGFDQSAMDGYALRFADLRGGKGRLRVVATSAAGEASALSCGAGEAVRVFTGAEMPSGADTVAMQEDVEVVEEAGEVYIDLLEPAASGEFVRREGEVVCVGQGLGGLGDPLLPSRAGLLASQGVDRVIVGQRPRVAVVTTGDELVEPGRELARGQIYNSNGAMLKAAAEHSGAEVVELIHARDDLAGTVAAMGLALERADIVVVAGGVSVGDRDFVKPATVECGAKTVFWRVNVRPGKPLLYATMDRGRQIFGLPGNPVSAMVCFTVFVLPALQHRLGRVADPLGAPRRAVRANEEMSNPSDRPHYLRGQIDASGGFTRVGLQESHGLVGLAQAGALVRVAAGAQIDQGAEIEALLL